MADLLTNYGSGLEDRSSDKFHFIYKCFEMAFAGLLFGGLIEGVTIACGGKASKEKGLACGSKLQYFLLQFCLNIFTIYVLKHYLSPRLESDARSTTPGIFFGFMMFLSQPTLRANYPDISGLIQSGCGASTNNSKSSNNKKATA
jgi:hypothetical protein